MQPPMELLLPIADDAAMVFSTIAEAAVQKRFLETFGKDYDKAVAERSAAWRDMSKIRENIWKGCMDAMEAGFKAMEIAP